MVRKKTLAAIVIASVWICFVLYLFNNSNELADKENNNEYSFVITRTDVTSKRKLLLYENDSLMGFRNYPILQNSGVTPGDSVSKSSKSRVLLIYKKDSNGKYKEYTRINASNP